MRLGGNRDRPEAGSGLNLREFHAARYGFALEVQGQTIRWYEWLDKCSVRIIMDDRKADMGPSVTAQWYAIAIDNRAVMYPFPGPKKARLERTQTSSTALESCFRVPISSMNEADGVGSKFRYDLSDNKTLEAVWKCGDHEN
ncbi:hypothetical protein E1B28_009226 [Marasmius oreades]|uniref:Uncharacterized protein n=1 Tax=Marasmius oreades TaxID=181124 RepID=A0A9P7S017_9AGAR|nr:uncharacterized protein E1B28_009226 [Marasmius oreades]KAG7092921.1 hypothetical protein E1B28_009226 [Marasmius oreades]